MDAPLKAPAKAARPERTPQRRYKLAHRSRVTNGRALLEGVDHRTAWVRRLRDLIQLHMSDLGGAELASEGEKAIVRRICVLGVEMELIERKLALQKDGGGHKVLLLYQRMANTQRRLLEAISTGLPRRPRDVTATTLGQILQSEAAE